MLEAMRFCISCGAEVQQDDRFCTSCGIRTFGEELNQIDAQGVEDSSLDDMSAGSTSRLRWPESEDLDELVAVTTPETEAETEAALPPSPWTPPAPRAPLSAPAAPDPESFDTESFDTESFDTESFDTESFDTESFDKVSTSPVAARLEATHSTTCAYCLSALGSDPVEHCDSCGTPHHTDCWAEYGGCAIYGCENWLRHQMVGPASPGETPTSPTLGVSAQERLGPSMHRPGIGGPTPPAWHPDPLGRHAHRYWDGTKWTAIVADRGTVSNDSQGTKPTPLPLPPGGSSAAESWYVDPSGRHQYRFWNGRRWTDRVADDGVVGTDAASMSGV